MNKETFIVSYSSSRHCFLKFSRNYLSILNSLKVTVPALKVEYELDKSAFFSWSSYPHNSDNNVVFLSAKYAQELGITEKELIQVSFYPDVPVVSRAYITPLSVDDLTILESNSSKLQSTLLNQVRIVSSGQVLVVWASKNVHLTLKVGILEPHSTVGYLENFTEVVLDSSHNYLHHHVKSQMTENDFSQITAPASNLKTPNGEYSDSLLPWHSLWNSLRNSLSSFHNKYSESTAFGSDTDVSYNKSNFKLKSNFMLLRVNPWKHNIYLSELSFAHPYTVFISKELIITENIKECFDSLICKISFVPYTPKLVKDNSVPIATHELSKPFSYFHKETLIVQVCILDNVLNMVPKGIKQDFEFYSCHQPIYVSETVMNSMNLHPGCRMKIEECIECKHCVKQLKITVAEHWDKDDQSIISLFRANLKKYTKERSMPLNSGVLFPLLDEENNIFYIIVTLLPFDATYFLVDLKVASEISVLVERRIIKSDIFHKKSLIIDEQTGDLTVRWLYELLQEGMTTLKMSLNLGSVDLMSQNVWPKVSLQNILITGGNGSGKSCLAKLLVEKIKSSPFFVHTEEHNCKELKGKSIDSIQRSLTSTLSECVYYQPSVILLDDLDAIAGKTEQEISDPSYFNRVTEMICSQLETFQERNFIAVVATAEELSKLNPLISDSRGQHIFKTVLEIPKLTKNHRHDIMKGILNNASNVNLDNCTLKDLEEFAVKTDGYVLQDLNDFVAKSILECWKRTGIDDSETPYLEYKDLSSAFTKSIPMALRGVSLYHETNCSWDDVGGLKNVKEILIEMLEWPTQYPELFEQSPLRPQSGILLYGAPGTGKTLLASAVAKECGLNFISIKGPELLSKYIGASEEAVRKIFQKAQVAKPCILFFDEFESLAPRRGHDNTGVTDRVVNQLLTQLDGVEGLHGVWVLAASSRPDLLDPALLRPGRLDQTVLCPLPSENDRKCILQVLSRKLNLSNDIDFEEISKKSDGFTGADLQAVLYTAQIMSMEDVEDTNEETVILSDMPEIENKEWKVISNPEQIIVTQKHVLAALAKTRPSLSVSEKLKYERIYENFRSSRKFGRSEEMEASAPRVTLA